MIGMWPSKAQYSGPTPSHRCGLTAVVRMALALWLVIIFAPAPALAQQGAPAETALPSEVAAPVDRLTKGIEAAEKAIQHLTQLEEELGRLRIDVEVDPEQLQRDSGATPPSRCGHQRPDRQARSATREGCPSGSPRHRRRAGSPQCGGSRPRRGHQVHRAHLGSGAPAHPAHHGYAPRPLYPQSARTPVQSAAA